MIELWEKRTTEDYSVRLHYTAQTPEQMRFAPSLTPSAPPQRVPIFLPGCSEEEPLLYLAVLLENSPPGG